MKILPWVINKKPIIALRLPTFVIANMEKGLVIAKKTTLIQIKHMAILRSKPLPKQGHKRADSLGVKISSMHLLS
jgi:hypothetical protein